jgi:hypothetical protein
MLSEVSYGQLNLIVVFLLFALVLVFLYECARVLFGGVFIVTPYMGKFLWLLFKVVCVIVRTSIWLLFLLFKTLFDLTVRFFVYLYEPQPSQIDRQRFESERKERERLNEIQRIKAQRAAKIRTAGTEARQKMNALFNEHFHS